MTCKQCGSHAINHHSHGRDGSDGDLCDVCYWRKRAEDAQAQWPTNAAEVREFLSSHCACVEYKNEDGTPHDDDKYRLTAHDLLEAVQWWLI